MHILLITPTPSYHTEKFLRALLDANYKVTLVTKHKPKLLDNEKYRYIRYPMSFGLRHLKLRLLKQLGNLICALQLRIIWQIVKPDLVHVHYIEDRALHCTWAGLHPLLFTCWGSDINSVFNTGSKNGIEWQNLAYALRSADHITADSYAMLERCKAVAGQKIPGSLFFFGIDTKRFKPGYENEAQAWRQELGIGLGTKVLVSVRSLRRYMGHHHVIESIANIVNDSQMPNIALLLSGFGIADSYQQELRALVNELHLANNIYWLQEIPNERMPILYSMADVIVNYAEVDAFPVTFFETAACKRPLITSMLPDYADIFGPESFLFVPPANVPALEKSIRLSLTESPDAQMQRIDNAFAIVERVGEWHQCFSSMQRIYTQLTNPQYNMEKPVFT